MSDYLDKIHNASRDLRDVSRQIEQLAKALNRVGMSEISTELFALSTEIFTYQDIIINAVGTEINREYIETRNQTANLLGKLLDKSLATTENKNG